LRLFESAQKETFLNNQMQKPKKTKVNFDIAAKRHRTHKNQISGLVNSVCYNEQTSRFRIFYESINFKERIKP